MSDQLFTIMSWANTNSALSINIFDLDLLLKYSSEALKESIAQEMFTKYQQIKL